MKEDKVVEWVANYQKRGDSHGANFLHKDMMVLSMELRRLQNIARRSKTLNGLGKNVEAVEVDGRHYKIEGGVIWEARGLHPYNRWSDEKMHSPSAKIVRTLIELNAKLAAIKAVESCAG